MEAVSAPASSQHSPWGQEGCERRPFVGKGRGRSRAENLLWAEPGLGLELGWGWQGWSRPGLQGPLLLGLCFPLLASSGTACVRVQPPLQVYPTWPSTWPCPKHPGPHLYANHRWSPQLPASRGSRRNLHFLAPELAQPSGGWIRCPLLVHLTYQAAETRGGKGPGHRVGSCRAGVKPQPV